MKFSDFPRHHAILVTHENRSEYAESLWNELGENPANRFFNQTVLDIDTARSIISWAQSPYNDERVALISFHTVGLPAQNAMLKVLEEPRTGTRFILLTTNKDHLIDTVLSRVHHVHIAGDGNEQVKKVAKEFLATSSAFRMRLSHILDLLAKQDEEGRKDREGVKTFILSLVDALRDAKAPSRYILETLQVASYASDPSVSGKALIEYLSLLLPQTK
jgi:hypothetical protein